MFTGVKDNANKLFTCAFDTGNKTLLPITAYLYLKTKNKQIEKNTKYVRRLSLFVTAMQFINSVVYAVDMII